MRKKIIICLVGPSGAGKSTVANLLTDFRGVKYISLSTKVREHVSTLGIESPSRGDLQIHANQLRREKGNGVFAQMVIDSINHDDEYEVLLVDGVRHPDEINILRSTEVNGYVLGVTSDQRKRFERILARQRPSDPKTWEEFLECDRRENGDEGQEHQQENAKCIQMADFVVHNDGNLRDLYEGLADVLEKIHEGEITNELRERIK